MHQRRATASAVPTGLSILTTVFASSGCDTGPIANGTPDPDPSGLAVELVAEGFQSPVHLTGPPQVGSPSGSRLFVVEQRGRIQILGTDGTLHPTPFLDITERVSCCGERGLLSVAFHPDYESTGWFFINFTDRDGNTRIERYTVSADPNAADAGSAHLILELEQPFSNHNGGLSLFGPDGMLYVGLGDGGSAGDPRGHGQDPNTLLGSILRIDIDRGDPYTLPADNPFVGREGTRPEVWAYGVRNPWRFSFDPETGALFIADVGQNQWEEINRISADEAGVNLGWNVMEGSRCYQATSCDQSGLTLPIAQYPHSEGCSITGGHVYRGSSIPEVEGQYFFADYCQGWVRSLDPGSGTDPIVREWDLGDLGQVTSFGEDASGELYILTATGGVYRLVSGG